jgi:hypothetical protein
VVGGGPVLAGRMGAAATIASPPTRNHLLTLLRRGKKKPAERPVIPALTTDRVVAHDYTLRLQYHAKSGDGVRLPSQPYGPQLLPELLSEVAISQVDLVEPLSAEFQDAAPHITAPAEAMLWINARHPLRPLTRHALYLLESVDAIDPAYETLAVALLHGELDTDGLPRYDAIVGGLVSYWDETTAT